MDGKATLRLRRPLADNIQNLYFENYDVVRCEYSLSKNINSQGEVCNEVVAGCIHVTLPVFPTDEIMVWVFDEARKYNGEVTINDANKESLDKVYFEEGRCVGFRFHYDAKEEHGILLSLQINARRMIIGEVEYKRDGRK